MSNVRPGRVALIAGTMALVITAAPAARAQSRTTSRSVHTDSRWLPWLGCWQSDSVSTDGARSPSVACVTPVAGLSGVEALSVVRGRVVARERLDASGGAQPIDGQGCKGTETSSWSPSGRRVYLHADYTCSTGIRGTSRTLLALTPSGEWLRIEEVRSGNGSVVSVDRRRPAGASAAVPAAAVRAIDDERLLITTARAAAAAPVTPDEVIDATRVLGAGVVTAWLGATRQQFALDAQQTSTLLQADLPPSVVQAMLGASGQGATPSLNGTVYDEPQMRTGRIIHENPIVEDDCDYAVCYAPNAYSVYNGYARSSYGLGGYGVYGYTAFPYIGVPIVRYAPYGSGYGIGRDGRGIPGSVSTGRDGRGGASGRDHRGSPPASSYSGGNRPQPTSSRPPVGVRPRGGKPR